MRVAFAAEREGRASIRPSSVVDGVYDSIYHRLMSLEIAPGSRIPIDVFARDLGVSQTPIREALSRLEREGLVRKEHLIGYSAAPQWTRRQFEDLYVFRLLVEPEAARLAAVNMTPDALRQLENSAADMGHGEAPVDRNTRYSRFARADAQFHDAILKVAGNEVIRSTLSNQHVHLHIFRLMFHTRVTQEALEEHENLLAAFRAGDPQAAFDAMRIHIERSRDRLLSAFE
ncbi:GntR family transcriptional regulator [Sinorhizobium medicae]|uniref:GntR family transcriptional regulator n=1 Tax=Sinorhizobium medicae TaxID=110321 RepID=UPI001AAF08FF|nr:FCD domain-containing protein [Sinorhizobium medicae]MBO1960059.1 GntR family transcriptional regulator [Sinorhizobium medicae]WQO54704.1 GntR family transcriptional regulator [Sinorhizobium medicae]WQP40440.1 GntR family transcriptional regulator [Sinorhizobium medicae]